MQDQDELERLESVLRTIGKVVGTVILLAIGAWMIDVAGSLLGG